MPGRGKGNCSCIRRAWWRRNARDCSALTRGASLGEFRSVFRIPAGSRYRVGRQQHCVEFAAHDVGIHAQAAVLLHRFGGQLAVGFGYSVSRAMETP
ncbi:MAG: hypothetical protein ACLVK0_12895 [Parabacteroides merdae]